MITGSFRPRIFDRYHVGSPFIRTSTIFNVVYSELSPGGRAGVGSSGAVIRWQPCGRASGAEGFRPGPILIWSISYLGLSWDSTRLVTLEPGQTRSE